MVVTTSRLAIPTTRNHWTRADSKQLVAKTGCQKLRGFYFSAIAGEVRLVGLHPCRFDSCPGYVENKGLTENSVSPLFFPFQNPELRFGTLPTAAVDFRFCIFQSASCSTPRIGGNAAHRSHALGRRGFCVTPLTVAGNKMWLAMAGAARFWPWISYLSSSFPNQ